MISVILGWFFFSFFLRALRVLRGEMKFQTPSLIKPAGHREALFV